MYQLSKLVHVLPLSVVEFAALYICTQFEEEKNMHFDSLVWTHNPTSSREGGRGEEGRATRAFAPRAPSVRGHPNGDANKIRFIRFIAV